MYSLSAMAEAMLDEEHKDPSGRQDIHNKELRHQVGVIKKIICFDIVTAGILAVIFGTTSCF